MNSETKVISIIILITALVIVGGLSLTKNGPKANEIKIDATSLIASTTPVQGAQNAKVSIVEFGDFACPACAMLAPNLEAALASSSPTDVSWALRLIPIHGADSINSAVAAFAAREQNPAKFFEMGRLLFAHQTDWTGKGEAKQKEIFIGYAKEIKLDVAKFTARINDATLKNQVTDILAKDNADAMKMSISSTPTIIFNGKSTVIGVQSAETLKEMIAAEAGTAANMAN